VAPFFRPIHNGIVLESNVAPAVALQDAIQDMKFALPDSKRHRLGGCSASEEPVRVYPAPYDLTARGIIARLALGTGAKPARV
jgi:hypothetical protein